MFNHQIRRPLLPIDWFHRFSRKLRTLHFKKHPRVVLLKLFLNRTYLGFCWNAYSDSIGLWWGCRFCISNSSQMSYLSEAHTQCSKASMILTIQCTPLLWLLQMSLFSKVSVTFNSRTSVAFLVIIKFIVIISFIAYSTTWEVGWLANMSRFLRCICANLTWCPEGFVLTYYDA